MAQGPPREHSTGQLAKVRCHALWILGWGLDSVPKSGSPRKIVGYIQHRHLTAQTTSSAESAPCYDEHSTANRTTRAPGCVHEASLSQCAA